LWADGFDLVWNPPEVVMVVFDKYTGPAFYLPDGMRLFSGDQFAVPILRVREEFALGNNNCYKE